MRALAGGGGRGALGPQWGSSLRAEKLLEVSSLTSWHVGSEPGSTMQGRCFIFFIDL